MLKIFNTLGRELQEFKPIKDGEVKFYHCGPTVYSTQHIGNMRGMVMGDLIRRSLIYLGYNVDYVRNYTDFGHLTGDNLGDADTGDDRMNKAAVKEGKTPQEIAQQYIDQFDQDVNALNLLWPDHAIKATDYIQAMIAMVSDLLEKGFAYTTPEAIYFDVTKFPDYTKLSGKILDKEEAGAGHGEADETNKKHPADFAIWFFKTGPHANALQYWASPFSSPLVKNGEGFPGWHIECSAMVREVLGKTIDLHMGGIEHISIHHPNEIAQSEAANGVKYVNYWIHNEHLLVDGGKMSKSDGTGYSLEQIIEKGYLPLDLRYFFLGAHYRSKQNFTWEALTAAQTAYTRLKTKIGELFTDLDRRRDENLSLENTEFSQLFRQALEDDFNIPQALAIVWDVLKSDLSPAEKLETVLDFDQVLGLELESKLENPEDRIEIPEAAQALITEREQARAAKDWQKADMLRDLLRTEYGVEVKDAK